MITKTSTTTPTTALTRPNAEQLTLLPNDSVTPRFRLSRDTRERGLRHVAEIRRMLAERSGALEPASTRHDRAA
jgi:hypothetical protein